MKIPISIRSSLFALTGILLYAFCFTEMSNAQEPVNNNGSFESSNVGDTPDNNIAFWSFSGWPDLAGFEIVDDPVQDGIRALQVVINETGDNPWNIQAVNEEIPVDPEQIYTYSVWAKSSKDGATASFTVGNYDFQEYGRIDASEVSLTSEWQEFTFQFTIGDGQTLIRAPIHFNYDENLAGTSRGGGPPGSSDPVQIYIDNLRIFVDEVEMVPPPSTIPLAEGHEKFLGNVYSSTQVVNAEYYWNQLTPENAGKWGTVESTQGEFDWSGMDAAYSFAKEHGMQIRFHVLVWGSQQPQWLHDLSNEEQLAAIDNWFSAVSNRYPDMEYVEVVNEPMNDPPFYKDALGGDGSSGWDWVITSFEMARQYFPNAKLMINEYGIISARRGTLKNYRDLVTLLQSHNLIDGIGVQGHAFSTNWQAASVMVDNLDYLAETGLPIQITEMDVDGVDDNGNLDDQIQLEEYQRIFPPFWEHEAVEGITLWGWKPGMWRTEQGAYIVHTNGEERPATPWLRDYLAGLLGSGSAKFAGFEDKSNETPVEFQIFANYPNPFNPTTQIKYDVPNTSNVKIVVYDIQGRHIQTLVDEVKSPGNYTVTFNANNLASGVYLYRFEAGSFISVNQMMLIK